MDPSVTTRYPATSAAPANAGAVFPGSVSNPAFLLLSITCICLFAGRAWQHLRWDAPFRTLLWDQQIMEPWVNRVLGISWQAYAGSPATDAFIQGIIRGFGAFYILCVMAAWPMVNRSRWRNIVLAAGSLCLLGLTLLYGMEKFWRIGELLEYASQWMAPFLLILARTDAGWNRPLGVLARLAVAGTFLGHGLYAAGFHPVPGPFVDLVIQHLGVSEPAAHDWLLAMGILDFLVAGGMLLPARFAVPFLVYAAVWGGATALARLGWGFDTAMPWFGMSAWAHEVLYRVPHATVPLFLLILCKRSRRDPEKPKAA